MTERDELALGLSRSFLPEDDKRARYVVAQSVRLLPTEWLAPIIAHEIDRYGPLRPAHRFEWDARDMRAPSPQPPEPTP